MSIPKLNGIAAIMYGWHYLHVVSCRVFSLAFFFSLSEDWWTLRGKTEAIFSRYSCQPPAEGAPTLAPGGCYVQIDFMYRVISSHTYTWTMPPQAPELKARSVGSWPNFKFFLKKIKMFKDYQLYKVYKIPQKQNKKERNIFFIYI